MIENIGGCGKRQFDFNAFKGYIAIGRQYTFKCHIGKRQKKGLNEYRNIAVMDIVLSGGLGANAQTHAH